MTDGQSGRIRTDEEREYEAACDRVRIRCGLAFLAFVPIAGYFWIAAGLRSSLTWEASAGLVLMAVWTVWPGPVVARERRRAKRRR